MERYLFPIDDKGWTFSYAQCRMVKLSPVMQSLVRALHRHGYVDPIRDGGRSGTFVALIQRGILREAKGRNGRHYAATTPAQVEADAYDEAKRRAAETEAHAECPEQWMQADEGNQVRHVRRSRQGYLIEVEESGYGIWYVRINGRTPLTAGGTFEEARLAADRFERNQAHAEHSDRREVESAQIAQDVRDGNYTLVTGEPISAATGEPVTPAQAHQRAAQEAAEAYNRGDIDDQGNWQGPIDKAAVTSRRVESLMDSGVADLTYNLPEGANMALATGEPQQLAPSLADDVAALLTQYGTLCAEVAVQRDDRLAVEPFDRARAIRREILDRIAAQAPQRAMSKGILSRPLWQHETCRHVDDITPGPGLTHCHGCGTATDKWQALYTLSGQ